MTAAWLRSPSSTRLIFIAAYFIGMKLFLFTVAALVLAPATFCCWASGGDIRDSAVQIRTGVPPAAFDPLAQTRRFTANGGQHFDFKIPTADYCYLIIKAQSRTPGEYVLCVNNTSLDTVLVYGLQAGGAKERLYEGGTSVNYDPDRACVWHTASVALAPEPSYYLIAFKAPAQNINAGYRIMTPQAFRRWYGLLDHLVYAYGGFVLFISLLCFAGGLLFRRKALLIYTGYVLALAAWILAHYGYLFPVFYPTAPQLNTIVKQVTGLVSMACLLNLISVSFKNDLRKRWIRNTFLVLKTFTALLILFYLVYLTGIFGARILMLVNIFWNISLLVSVCFVLTALSTLFKTARTARLFSAAISLVSLMAVYQSLSNLGWLYTYFLNEHGMMMASVAEILLLTFGLFYNLWQEKQDKEKELSSAEGERTRVLQMLIGVQEEERRRIAGDLHDSIGPMLAAIKINFMRLAKAKAEGRATEELATRTDGIIDESIAEIRAISHRLMPKSLSSKGLIMLLQDYFGGLEATHGIRINFAHDINVSLDKEVQLNLYRMISELSLNAAKHSGAEWLCVAVKTGKDETVVEIKDDGAGFARGAGNGSSLGIQNVQSRVDYLNGRMELVSAPAKGTRIEIAIPHRGDESQPAMGNWQQTRMSTMLDAVPPNG